MADFTKYQQKVVKNYYDNRESIALQRVQELVTDLYLGTKADTIAHLRKQNKPELVADLVRRMLSKE